MDRKRTLAMVIGVSLLMVLGLLIFPSILFLFPLAFIVIGVKYSIMFSFICIILTSFLVGVSIDMVSGLMVLAIFGPMALHIADCINNRKKPVEIIVPSSIIFFISVLMVFIMLRDYSGISLVEQLEENIRMYADLQLNLVEEMELTNIESFRMKELANDIYSTVIYILPAILIIMSVAVSYMNYYLSTVILRKMGVGIRDNPRFSRFSLPNNFIIGSLLMFLIIYLLRNFESFPYDMIYFNIIVLVISLLLIQGLSVLDFLLIRSKMNTVVRVILLGMTVLASPIISLFTFVGVLDIIFDFRKIRRRKL